MLSLEVLYTLSSVVQTASKETTPVTMCQVVAYNGNL